MAHDTRLPSADFHRLAATEAPGDSDLIICKALPGEADITEEGDRILTFTISTGDVDREEDTLSLSGWSLDNFRRGGAVLWNHLWDQAPIAKPLKTWVDAIAGKLKSTAEFTPQEINPFGYMVYQLAKHGFSRSTSVGFRPLAWARAQDRNSDQGIDFISQELTEWSIVNVPANPNALIEAKGVGIDLAPMRDRASALLDNKVYGPMLNKDALEVIYHAVDDKQTTVVDLGASSAPEETAVHAPEALPEQASQVCQPTKVDELKDAVIEGRKAEGALAEILVEKLEQMSDDMLELLLSHENLLGIPWHTDKGAALADKLCGPREPEQRQSEPATPDGLTQSALKDLLSTIQSLQIRRVKR